MAPSVFCINGVWLYSPILHYEQLLDMDTSLLRTVFFVGGEENSSIFSKLNLLNTGIFYGPLSFCINGVWLYS